jgi:hypothetical protein
MSTINEEQLAQALGVLGLQLPVTREQLDQKRRELLHTWNPARYANVTNNPKKYMQAYKKGEEMTKEIEAAYRVVAAWLDRQDSDDTGQASTVKRHST